MSLDRILAYINEFCMLASVAWIAVGWWRIKHHRVRAHRAAMLTGSAFAAAFFVTYVLKTLLVGDSTFGGPRSLNAAYLAFLQIHVTLATVAAVLGVITLRYAFRANFRRHRRWAPWTAGMWFVAAGTGLVVFLLLYVVYRPGTPTNVVRTITGLGSVSRFESGRAGVPVAVWPVRPRGEGREGSAASAPAALV